MSITQYFKDLINGSKVFWSVKEGDLVWCEMPFSKASLEDVEESHRTRPYFVIKKNFLSFEAYPCTSQSHVRESAQNQYLIRKEKYDINKNTTILFKKHYRIPLYKIRSYYYSVDEFDLNEINKRLSMRINSGKREILYCAKNDDLIECDNLKEGDVINYKNSLLYIFREDTNKYICYKLMTKPAETKGKFVFQINNIAYVIDHSQRVEIPNDSSYVIMSTINLTNVIRVDEEIKNEKKKKKIANSSKQVKKTVESKENKEVKLGNIYKVKHDNVVFLYEKGGNYYGVSKLMYNITPKIIMINDIVNKEKTGKVTKKALKEIVYALIEKKVSPAKEINKVYNELCEIVED